MISHNRAQALASARMDDALAPDDERALQLHLLGCASCRHFATQADGLAHGLRGLPQLPPSPNVSRQVMETVAAGRSAWPRLFGDGFRLASSPALAVAGSLVLVAALAFTFVLALNPPGDRSDRPSVPGPVGDQAVVFATETAAADAAEATAPTARRRLDIAGVPTATTAEEPEPTKAAEAPTAEAEPARATRPTNVTVTVTPTRPDTDEAPVPPADTAPPTVPPSEAPAAERAASTAAEPEAAGTAVETEADGAADAPAANPPSAEDAAAAFASPTKAVAPAPTAPVATQSPPSPPEPTAEPSLPPDETEPPMATATETTIVAPEMPGPVPTEVGIVVVATAPPTVAGAAPGGGASATVATDDGAPPDGEPTVVSVEEPETTDPVGPSIVPSEGSEVVEDSPGASSEAPVSEDVEDAEFPVEAPIIESVDRDPGIDRGLIQGAPVDVPAEPGIGLATPVPGKPPVAIEGSDAIAPAAVGEAEPVATDDAVSPVAPVPAGAAEARPDRRPGDGDAPPIDREADAAPRDEGPPRERRADAQGENEGRSARNDADAPQAEDASTDDEDARRTATRRRRQERDGDRPRPTTESPPIVAAPSPTPIVIAGVTVHLGEPGDPAVVVGRGLNGATRTPEPVE